MKGLGYQENCLPKYQKKLLDKKGKGNVIFYTSERNFPFANYENTYSSILGQRIGNEGVDSEHNVKILKNKPVFESVARCLCLFNPFNLYKTIKREKINVIHLHGATNLNVIFLVVISFFLDFKLFIDCHSDENNSKVTSKKNKLFYFFMTCFYKIFYRKVTKFLPVAKSCERYLETELKIPGEKMIITPLCFDSEYMFYDDTLAENLRSELSDEQDTTFLGCFGKISPEKNVLESLKVFSRVTDKLKNKKFKFLIVGSGSPEYIKDIKKYIEDNGLTNLVLFSPMQGREELRGYLSLCTAAFWIGSASNCIQEAMGCKTVPFLMKSTATEQLAIDERQIIDLSRIDLAIDNVCSVLDDDHINAIIETYASENFTWENSAKTHINIYQGIK